VLIDDAQYPAARSQIVPDGAGNAILVWVKLGVLCVGKVASNGTIAWKTTVPSSATGPVAVSDGAAGVIVAWSDWTSGTPEVRAQRIRSDGSAAWSAPTLVATGRASQTLYSVGWGAVAADGAGGAYIAYSDLTTGVQQLRLQRLSASGALLWGGGGVAAKPTPSRQLFANLVAGGSGVFAFWVDGPVNAGAVLSVNAFHPDGTPAWPADKVVAAVDHGRTNVDVVSDGHGGACVAWDDFRAAGRALALPHIYAQHMLGNGDMLWTPNGTHVGGAGSDGVESEASMAPDGQGGAWITWTESDVLDAPLRLDINVARFDANAANAAESPAGGDVICDADGMQHQPKVIDLGASQVLIDWLDERRDDGFDLYAWRSDVTPLVPSVATPLPTSLHFSAHAVAGHAVELGFDLAAAARMELRVTDVQGRALAHRIVEAGRGLQSVRLGVSGAVGQIVFATVTGGGAVETRKVALLP